MTDAINASDLTYRYPKGTFALSCPELSLSPGELTLVIGPNGSGKTTLSKLICGILKPQKGSLFIFGERANDWSLGKIGGQIGYLFQDPSRQLFTSTVWDEMVFVDQVLGKDTEASRGKAMALLERFDMRHLCRRSVYRLSRGEKQRLALCALLMGGPKYLILDEPTTALDRHNREKLYSLMDELVSGGTGLAVITHETELIQRHNGSVVMLAEGKVLT